jgi:two-component system, cell cycle sensor histidine kinase and response regulator CckA
VFQPRDLDLSESIANTIKMLKRILGENVQMQLKLAPQPMFIHADAGMMDQVLLNLVVNARDAMPKGGQLIIETSGAEIDEPAVSQSAQARPG